MANIICIETSTKVCSVSLGTNGKLRSFKEIEEENYSHSENLNLFVKDVLESGNVGWDDIDAIAISAGPGSYTGLRIGTSTAKAFCYARRLPLIAISTLQSMADSAQKDHKGDYYIPMIDARRMEVFTAVYDKDGKSLEPVSAEILDVDSYKAYLTSGKTFLFGDGSDKFKDLCFHDNAGFIELKPSAKWMISLAEEDYNNENFVDMAYFEPAYLKDFVAGN